MALDSKASNRDVDRLAREGDYDWSLLPNLAEELVLAPLRKYVEPEFADLVGQWLDYMHDGYRTLVANVTLDSLSRDEALPLLIRHYFALHALGLVVGIRKGFGGPELTKLLDPEESPVAVVLEWLDQGEEMTLAKQAFPGTVDSDRADREMVNKWARGSDLPKLTSIKKFADALAHRGSVSQEKSLNLRRWLLVARALTYLEKESPLPFREAMLRHLLMGMPDLEVLLVLSMAAIFAAEKFSILKAPARMLYEKLNRTEPKEPGEQELTRLAIEDLEQLTAEHDPEGNTRFYSEWMKARWHVLSGHPEDALTCYETAVELGSYRAGEMLKPIMEEALALAAFLEKKAALKRLKNRAVAGGMFADPQTTTVIEDWELAQMSQQFNWLFPQQGRFLETNPKDENPQHGLLACDEESLQKLQPDLAKPDRVRSVRFLDGQVRRWPQLRLFASFGRAKEVAALLQHGVTVDQLDEAGASALLCAIQYAIHSGDRQVLDLLLLEPHGKATLDSATEKKQLTPLLCAVDYGEPDVVEKLLKMGATADRRGNIVDQTPLHYVMETLGAVRYPAKLYRHLYNSLSTEPDLVQQEVLRRYNVSFAGVFGDGRGIKALMETPLHKELFEKLVAAMVVEKVARHSLPKLIRIAELLLEHKANPNAPHRYPTPGRTPLMMAAENNSGLAFELMMRKGGNPYQPDAAGLDCAKIAMGFRAAEVVGYLRSEGIV
ncbi:ankyrin repeat domain-containing protein [Rhodocyclus tenuis]|uniref:ankyrin repeat domain-containing protein n=1 Tax=Rhodocyclus gracilis TaxID=2929842 RepID=UPI001298DD49|nr:ankyrin repeat domain-containing protein [Rhodocyclus gracilis]MRD74130.1 ankyrin repeat domain-containing protein [Rhodocyclus gracilis]